MAQSATAATLLGGCSSARPPPSTCRPGSKVSDLRESAVTLAAFRSFSRACSGTDTRGTLIRRNFVGKKTDPSRAEETLSGIGAKKQRTLTISYTCLFAKAFGSRRTHALFRLPATQLTATQLEARPCGRSESRRHALRHAQGDTRTERHVSRGAARGARPSPRDIIQGGLGQLLELLGQLELRLARLDVAVELDAVAEVARDEPG